MLLLTLFAFISGVLTLLAPCIWPILPVLVSTITQKGRKRIFGVTLGVSLSFAFFTLSLSYIVKLIPFDPDILRIVAAIIVLVMGLTFVIPKLSAILETWIFKFVGNKQLKQTEDEGFKSSFLLGLSLGALWTPCAGPILASVASLSATRQVSIQVIIVTLAYAFGTGFGLYLALHLGKKLFGKSKGISKNLGNIQKGFGFLMIFTAIAISFGWDTKLQVKLLDSLPSFSNLVTYFEKNELVTEKLGDLYNASGVDFEENKIQESSIGSLPVLRDAKEFIGIERWINSDPLTIESLKGKVVLVDFWTYTCINCIRTLPYVTAWYEKYKDDGFVVIGVHTPEFEFEKDYSNVLNATKDYGINYPVAQDNDYKTWRNYSNRYWPAKYLIDTNGKIRYTHFGEGKYSETEQAIRQLLDEAGELKQQEALNLKDLTPKNSRTPETYLGIGRADRFASKEKLKMGENSYTFGSNLKTNEFRFLGIWDVSTEYSQSVEGSVLELSFTSKKVFLVISPGEQTSTVTVKLNGNTVPEQFSGEDVNGGVINITSERLYEVLNFDDTSTSGTLRLEFNNSGIKVFAFTFG